MNNVSESKYVYNADNGTDYIHLQPRNTGSNLLARLNSSSSQTSGGGLITDSKGLWITVREDNSTLVTYRNAVIKDTEAVASTNIPNDELEIFRFPTAVQYSTHQVALFFVMDGLTAGEVIGLNGICETYMDAIGTGVQ
jgi:hypothetical protein